MSINLVTYANQTVTPTNDAIIYEKAVDQNGIFYGCNVTVTSNTVNITGGYGLVCGREFVINSDSLTVTLAPSGTLQGRLYVRLDLADADAPIQLLTATGNTLPALEQDDDVNFTNGVYEMELATFTVGVSALSDVVETFDIIVGGKTDFVVEDGTANGWTYRKWNSGIAEAWTLVSNGSTAMTSAEGSGYYAPLKTYTFPSIFVTVKSVTTLADLSGSLGGFTSSNITTTSLTGYFWATRSITKNTFLNIEVKGTWK